MTADLESAGIAVHSVDDMLPDYTANPVPYQLSPRYDRRPGAAANDLIARYVTREILRTSAGD